MNNALLLVLIGVLVISPFVLVIAARQDKKTKNTLRNLSILLLFLQLAMGLFNWETLTGPGRTGYELALAYPSSFLGIFFLVSLVQLVIFILNLKQYWKLAVILNFANTVILFAGMIRIGNMMGVQIINLVLVATVFSVLVGNVIGLVFINKDRGILSKYPF